MLGRRIHPRYTRKVNTNIFTIQWTKDSITYPVSSAVAEKDPAEGVVVVAASVAVGRIGIAVVVEVAATGIVAIVAVATVAKSFDFAVVVAADAAGVVVEVAAVVVGVHPTRKQATTSERRGV